MTGAWVALAAVMAACAGFVLAVLATRIVRHARARMAATEAATEAAREALDEQRRESQHALFMAQVRARKLIHEARAEEAAKEAEATKDRERKALAKEVVDELERRGTPYRRLQ